MLRFFKSAPPTHRLLGLLALALVVLVILLTIATPARAGRIQTQAARSAAVARASNNQPTISSPPPNGVTGPSHRAPVRLSA